MNFSQFSGRMIAALAAGAAFGVGASAAVGLVNQLQGDVFYQGTGSAGAKAAAFMKVRDGDKFSVPDGGVLRIVYFEGGRQETWMARPVSRPA